jgi:hypothetical protein
MQEPFAEEASMEKNCVANRESDDRHSPQGRAALFLLHKTHFLIQPLYLYWKKYLVSRANCIEKNLSKKKPSLPP